MYAMKVTFLDGSSKSQCNHKTLQSIIDVANLNAKTAEIDRLVISAYEKYEDLPKDKHNYPDYEVIFG